MADPWESVDLTMTCDSDGETSLAPDEEPVVNIPRPPLGQELRRTPAKILPSLAQSFTEIYSRKCSISQERSCSEEGISSLSQNLGTQRSKNPGDPKPTLTVNSTFNIIPISFHNDLPEAKRTKLRPAFEFDSLEKSGLQCEEEVIEIDDDSNDQTANDAPARVIVSSDSENCHSAMNEDLAITESDHWEEVDIKYHDGEPPVLHKKSPDPNLLSPAPLVMSPEPHVPSPKPSLVSEQLDIPLFDKINGSTVPQYNILAADKQAEIETESIISIDSENESDNFLVQSLPSPMYYCMYCEYSTAIEECCRKHIAGHQPGTKPYLRMYCTECSLSTGSEKRLLFHMYKTHHIMKPELYRSGKERYTCSICKLTQKLRSDIESHIYSRHKFRNQVALVSADVKGKRTRAMRFQCVEKGCARNCKTIVLLRNHVINQHKIAPLSYFEFVPQKGKPSKHAMYGCFLCGFKGSDKRTVRLHAKMHYTSKKGPNVEDVTRTVTAGQSEEIARKNHNQATTHFTSPGPLETSLEHHEKSPNPHGNSSDADASPVLDMTSPEPGLVTPVPHTTSPEPDFVDDEQLIDMPEHDDESPSPPYDSYAEKEVQNDNESSDSDYNSENRQGQPRPFYCIYCEYSTVIEEWYHKHIASHLPGTKPYLRMYCTECTYSTGSERYLLFHMSQTHRIVNPEFYRSGEKRYTCRICKHTLELRIDIESHIKAKHKTEKQTLAKKKRDLNVIFQCSEEECGKCYNSLKCLNSHVQKHHNIRFPSYYYERSHATGELKFKCFSCNKTIEKKMGKNHAKMHYSSKRRRSPYLYYCPVPHENSKCPFSCKKRSEITEHYKSVHFKDLKYYKKRECTYACLNCPYIASSVMQMKNHCTLSCKK